MIKEDIETEIGCRGLDTLVCQDLASWLLLFGERGTSRGHIGGERA